MSHVISYRLRFGIQKESRSALFLYACFEAGIAFNGRTFFDTQKRLLSTSIAAEAAGIPCRDGSAYSII